MPGLTREQLDVLFTERYAWCLTLCRRWCKGRVAAQDIDDLVSAAILHLWKVADRYDPSIGEFGPWAGTTLRMQMFTVWCDHVRHVKHLDRTQTKIQRLGGPRPFAEATGDIIEHNDEVAYEVQRVWRSVKDGVHRTAEQKTKYLRMSLFQGMTYQEIADAEGVSKSTVQNMILRTIHEAQTALGVPVVMHRKVRWCEARSEKEKGVDNATDSV